MDAPAISECSGCHATETEVRPLNYTAAGRALINHYQDRIDHGAFCRFCEANLWLMVYPTEDHRRSSEQVVIAHINRVANILVGQIKT
jgi:hypothetical protein